LERTAWQQPVSAGAISERGKLQVWTYVTTGSLFALRLQRLHSMLVLVS